MSSIGPLARRITLLTDFDTQDGYAGAMRGVIAGIAPDAIVEDISQSCNDLVRSLHRPTQDIGLPDPQDVPTSLAQHARLLKRDGEA